MPPWEYKTRVHHMSPLKIYSETIKNVFMGYYGIPCKAAKWIHCLPIKFIYRLHIAGLMTQNDGSGSSDSDKIWHGHTTSL